MTRESIFNEFERQGYILNDDGKIAIEGKIFNFLPAIQPWVDGSITERFGDVKERMNEELLVSQLIEFALSDGTRI